MKKFLAALVLLSTASIASSQTPALTQPQVLGCINPAPATSGQATVFFSACKTTAFLPLTTTSVIASVSKTSPSWAHSLSGYLPTDKLVACPVGGTVSGSTCTLNGTDVSALVSRSTVSTFTVLPVAPPTVNVILTWSPPVFNTDGSPLTDLSSFNIYENGRVVANIFGGTLTYTISGVTPGNYTFGVSSINSSNTESDQTSVTQTIAPPAPKVPNAPTNVTVTVK